MAGANGFAGVIDFLETDPIWIPITVTFNDETWENVGFRFKGNSTLQGAWTGGSLKMGFKLNFDKYEDDFPEIKNQRFFGFDEISFSSNFRDMSYLHERIAADIFRDAGIPSARTAFYAVSFDYGEGAQYIGVYTAVEEVEDAVLDTQFSSDEGNLYKPEGPGATFAAGTFDEASFEKKTNEEESNFSDILALFAALHAATRTTDPHAWRTGLESVLDVDGFIHWLAVNTVIQNWDTYGTMPHNFYLYNNPDTGLLTWIPWDNNEALSGGGRGNNNSLDLTTTTDDWPLISFLMNDPVYHALYVDYVRQTMNTVFEPERMTPIYETQHALIAPYVNGTATGSADVNFVSQDSFDEALIQLIAHVNQRYALAQAYVDRQ
jgi:spore coat protein CotH